MRKIDVHAHYFPSDYLDLLETVGRGEVDTTNGRRSSWPSRDADLAARCEAMDQAGVDVQILSIATSGPYLSDAGAASRAARAVNDRYAEVVRSRPHRFAAFAALPLPHVEHALAELGRALDDLGMVGAGVATAMGGKTLDDPAFNPLYAELDRRAAVLFIHPTGGACGSPLLVRSGLAWPLGAPFEDTAAALQLLQSGFARRFPNVRVIVPHLGGTLPFLVARLDHMAERFMPGGGLPSSELKKFWYDTVNGHPAALRCACDTLGAGRLVFGSDYPFWRGEAHQLGAEYLDHAGLAAADLAAIGAGNAAALFGERYAPIFASTRA